MSSTLILKIFCLSEKFDSLVMGLFKINRRLTWDTKLFKWRIETNQRKLLSHYTILYVYGLLFNLGFANVVTILHIWFLEPNVLSLSTEYIVVYSFLLIFSCLVILFDLLIFAYGKECVDICNFWQTKELQLNQIYINSDCIQKSSFTSEILAIFKPGPDKNPDIFGIFLGNYVISHIFVSFVIPPIFVYYGWDPYAICLNLMYPNLQLVYKIIFQIMRLLSTFVAIYTAILAERSFLLFGMCFALTGEKIVLNLLKVQNSLSPSAVCMYRKLQVVFKVIQQFLVSFTGSFFTVAFLCVLIGFDGTIIGWKFVPWTIYVIVPMFTGFVMSFIWLNFKFGCDYYERSDKIIGTWRRNLMKAERRPEYRNNPKLARLMLKSLRRLTFPVGSVGVMDSEIKVNYLHALYDYIINSLVTIKEDLEF